MKFKKNIFQVWFQGEDKITDKRFIENIKNWKTLNPEWSYNCLSDIDLYDACKLFSVECGEIYNLLPLMHMKIDLGRYVMIYIYGGIYVDMDAYILRSLRYSKYVNECIKSVENNKDVIGISELTAYDFEKYISNLYYNNAIMLSSPKNPVLKKFIEQILENCKKYIHLKKNSFMGIQNSTGPKAFNEFFTNKKNLLESDIINFPNYIFEPCTLKGDCTITEDTVAIHQFEASWLSPSMVFFKDLYFIYIRDNIALIIMIVIICIYLHRYAKNNKF